MVRVYAIPGSLQDVHSRSFLLRALLNPLNRVWCLRIISAEHGCLMLAIQGQCSPVLLVVTKYWPCHRLSLGCTRPSCMIKWLDCASFDRVMASFCVVQQDKLGHH